LAEAHGLVELVQKNRFYGWSFFVFAGASSRTKTIWAAGMFVEILPPERC